MGSEIWGLAEKGIINKSEAWLVAPYKIIQVSKLMRMHSDPEQKKKIKSGCTRFNLETNEVRVHNEIMIVDLHSWAEEGGGRK